MSPDPDSSSETAGDADPLSRRMLNDEALAETLRTAPVVRVHHGNPDAYAEAWSDGWDEAHRQQVGGTETREWAVRQIRHQLQVGLLNRQPLDVLAEHLADSVLHEGDLSGDDEAREDESNPVWQAGYQVGLNTGSVRGYRQGHAAALTATDGEGPTARSG